MRSERGAAAALQRHSRAAKLAGAVQLSSPGFRSRLRKRWGKPPGGWTMRSCVSGVTGFEAAAQVQSGQAYLGRQPLAAVGQPSPRGSPRAEGGPAVLGPGATRLRRSGGPEKQRSGPQAQCGRNHGRPCCWAAGRLVACEANRLPAQAQGREHVRPELWGQFHARARAAAPGHLPERLAKGRGLWGP